jgi:hypothetical protein
MWYEINVSLNGKHFFATHERSCRWEDEMKKIVEVFKVKFPEEEGYEISVSRWETCGKGVEI